MEHMLTGSNEGEEGDLRQYLPDNSPTQVNGKAGRMIRIHLVQARRALRLVVRTLLRRSHRVEAKCGRKQTRKAFYFRISYLRLFSTASSSFEASSTWKDAPQRAGSARADAARVRGVAAKERTGDAGSREILRGTRAARAGAGESVAAPSNGAGERG